MNRIDALLREMLVGEGLIEKKALDDNSREGQNGATLLAALVEKGLVKEKAVLKLLAEKLDIPYKGVKNEAPDAALFKKIPIKVAWHYQFVPLALSGRSLTLGVYYPIDIRTQDEIRMQLGYDVDMVLSPRSEVLELLKNNYGLAADTVERMFSKDDARRVGAAVFDKEDLEDIEKKGDDATIANLVNQIIFDAYRNRATDIHIEPYRGTVRFRYRIDGALYEAHMPPRVKYFIPSIIARIKIMSNVDIVEHRVPQDGQAVVKTKNEKLDLRISFIPTPYGESVVVRILPTMVLYDINRLGLYDEDKESLEALLKKPNGIIFVTGPTGSGKTTTLYACLSKIKTEDRKIITIEDPIEYEMEGVTQIQVAPQVGLDFAAGLKSILRHDPDIIMVGEVRDRETAEIAVRVALTGHLVFSTLHTNSAATSIHRLIDIGIEPYLISSSTIAFIAQRLVRVLCPKCKAADEGADGRIIKFIRSQLGLGPDDKVLVHKKVGCEHCNHTGFYGRSAIYEIMPVDEKIKRLIMAKASAEEIEAAAVSGKMTTMLQSGLKKVAEGITTLEDIMSAISIENLKMEAPPAPAPAQDKVEPDKRVYGRLSTPLNATFTVFKDVSGEIKKKLKKAGAAGGSFWGEHAVSISNVSAGGLLFKYPLELFPGVVLEMKIALPAGPARPACVVGSLARVVRVEAAPEGGEGLNDIAVCFLDMSGADRVKIDNFVKENTGGG